MVYTNNAVAILLHAFKGSFGQKNVATNLKLAVGTAEVMRANGRYTEEHLREGVQFLQSLQETKKDNGKSGGRGSVNAVEKKGGSRHQKARGQVKGEKRERNGDGKCSICKGQHATNECRKCRTCKEEGHFARDCPKKKDKDSSDSSSSGEVNALTSKTGALTLGASGRETDHGTTTAQLAASSSGEPLDFSARITEINDDADMMAWEKAVEEFGCFAFVAQPPIGSGGTGSTSRNGFTRVLVDSGASHSVIPHRSWFITLEPCDMTFTTASRSEDSNVKCQWKGTIRVTLGGQVFDFPEVYLGPVSRPLLSMTSIVRAGFTFQVSEPQARGASASSGGPAAYAGWLIQRGNGDRLRCLVGREGLPFISVRPTAQAGAISTLTPTAEMPAVNEEIAAEPPTTGKETQPTVTSRPYAGDW
ncbi:hypothetical protein HDU96_001130, partial [Phlyctochytrium bullatum]